MIPLRFSIETNITSPFVARLISSDSSSNLRQDYLRKPDSSKAIYLGYLGKIDFKNSNPDEIEDDIFFIVPAKKIAYRLIRAKSKHNTFLVTECCDQLCLMCSQPPKKQHVDMFSVFFEIAKLSPPNMTIGISGGEPTLYKKDLFLFLSQIQEVRPDLSFHILTNAQHFTNDDIAILQKLNRNKIIWGIPLYSNHPDIHDKIVAKHGAFEKLLYSFSILGKIGHQIELRTVIMKNNAFHLNSLAWFIIDKIPFINCWAIMQLENIGYARKNWDEIFFDSSVHFNEIGSAIDIIRSRGMDSYLYNFPLCTIPKEFHSLAPPTISDWKQKYVEKCHQCSLKSHCGGLFEWHPTQVGYQRFGVI